MSTDPFAGPYTLREKWALFKARRVIRRCQRGKHCYRCGCWDTTPTVTRNDIVWNGGHR